MTVSSALRTSTETLAHDFDVALLDLDGVVYVGPEAVRGAPQALAEARRTGMRLAFVTNNAARTAAQVAEHLSALGIAAEAAEVTTSSQAAAHYLAERLPAGARVLAVGAVGLTEALRERGLESVTSADADPAAVVQGYSPETSWAMLAEASIAVNRGLLWVATNLDATLPSPRGPLPGNGSLIAAVQKATGRTPVATGKPDPTMHRESLERSSARNPIVVGDRLDTDIEGANAVGCASLLVLSGVTDAAVLLAAPEAHRPNFIGQDVSALLQAHAAPELVGDRFRCGAWLTGYADRSLFLGYSDDFSSPPTVTADDGLAALRALCAAAWSIDPADRPDQFVVAAQDERARRELTRLGLAAPGSA